MVRPHRSSLQVRQPQKIFTGMPEVVNQILNTLFIMSGFISFCADHSQSSCAASWPVAFSSMTSLYSCYWNKINCVGVGIKPFPKSLEWRQSRVKFHWSKPNYLITRSSLALLHSLNGVPLSSVIGPPPSMWQSQRNTTQLTSFNHMIKSDYNLNDRALRRL